MAQKINKKVEELIAKLWLQGDSHLMIEEKAGVSHNTVARVVRDYGLPSRGVTAGNKVKPELKERITQLWASGISVSQIGIMVGMTKNQVVGYAHRWELPKRPNPIANPSNKPREKKSDAELRERGLKRAEEAAKRRQEAMKAPKPAPPPIIVERPFTSRPSGRTCQYIKGDPRDLNFCAEPIIGQSVYCALHHSRCYVLKGSAESHDRAKA